MSGVLVMLGCAPVIHRSKGQPTFALSSAEAEFMALALAVQEVLWLRQLLQKMHVKVDHATTIYVDNTAAIAMARSTDGTSRAKHIDLRYHFIRDHIEHGAISIKHVRSADQLADYMTKPLATQTFANLVRRSGIELAS